MDLALAIKFFGALFAIMNPFVNLPVFLGITDGASERERRVIAVKVALFSFAMGLVVAFGGNRILGLFGVSVDDFRVAGGLVLLTIAFSMLGGTGHQSHEGSPSERSHFEDSSAAAFYPMTFPIIVGPGTITTLIVFSGETAGAAGWGAYVAVFAVTVALLGVVLVLAGSIGRFLSQTARVVMTRLMGMILAAIAVDMMAAGLKALLPGLG